MSPSVIVAGARTPMGRLLGSLKGMSAADLGGVAIARGIIGVGQHDDLRMSRTFQCANNEVGHRLCGKRL